MVYANSQCERINKRLKYLKISPRFIDIYGSCYFICCTQNGSRPPTPGGRVLVRTTPCPEPLSKDKPGASGHQHVRRFVICRPRDFIPLCHNPRWSLFIQDCEGLSNRVSRAGRQLWAIDRSDPATTCVVRACYSPSARSACVIAWVTIWRVGSSCYQLTSDTPWQRLCTRIMRTCQSSFQNRIFYGSLGLFRAAVHKTYLTTPFSSIYLYYTTHFYYVFVIHLPGELLLSPYLSNPVNFAAYVYQ